jgi:soluble lytic murein transglycosylase-like protein
MHFILLTIVLAVTTAVADDRWPSTPMELAMLEGEARYRYQAEAGNEVLTVWPIRPGFEVIEPPDLDDSEQPIDELVKTTAKTHGIDPQLVHAVITAESNYDPTAVSPKGAIGLMQLMPATAERLGVDPWNPRENVEGGVRYLKELLAMFGDVSLALAAYNAGEGAVMKYGRQIPPYRETQQYVARVLNVYAGG